MILGDKLLRFQGGSIITTTAAEDMAFPAMSEAAFGGHATAIGPAAGAPSSPPHMAAATASMGAHDNTVEGPEVIMGHPGLRALRTISLSEIMGTTHFTLNQVHYVLRRGREDINEEWLHL
jgi:hypothetical protein